MTDEFARWLVETSLAAAALAAIVMLLRGAVTRGLGASWAYALWVIPALRIILPPLPVAATVSAPADALSGFVVATAPTWTNLPAAAPSVDWVNVGLGLWLVGAVLFALWQIQGYRRFAAALRLDCRPAGAALSEIAIKAAARFDLKNAPTVLISTAAPGPLVVGWRRPCIVLPHDFMERFSAEEQRLALAHEVAHIVRGDLWLNAIALAVRAIHWPNPLIHLAYRYFRADQELACDQIVVTRAKDCARDVYGRALLKSASAGPTAAACPLNSPHHIKERLTMLKTHFVPHRGSAIGFGLIAGLTAIGLGLSASTVAADPEKGDEKVVKKEIRIVGDSETFEVVIAGGDGDTPKIFTVTGDGDGEGLATNHRFVIKKVRGLDGAETEVSTFVLAGEHGNFVGIGQCGDGSAKVELEKKGSDKRHSEKMFMCINGVDEQTPEGKAKLAEALRGAIGDLEKQAKRDAERRAKMTAALQKRLKELEASKSAK